MILAINTLSQSPIYEQIRDQVVLGIASKALELGEALPSVRRLAADLGVNFHTVNKAYTMLCDEGYVVMDRRKGAVISQNIEGNEAFSSRLSRQLILSAAEALCHNIEKNEFIEICLACYQSAKGDSKNGGKK